MKATPNTIPPLIAEYLSFLLKRVPSFLHLLMVELEKNL